MMPPLKTFVKGPLPADSLNRELGKLVLEVNGDRLIEVVRFGQSIGLSFKVENLLPLLPKQRATPLKISSSISGQGGRYGVQTITSDASSAASGDLAESDIGTVSESEDAIFWNVGEVGTSDHALANGTDVIGFRIGWDTASNKPVFLGGSSAGKKAVMGFINGPGSYGGGIYDGVALTGGLTGLSPDSVLTLPSGVDASGVPCIIVNPEEDQLPTHWINGNTYVECDWDGATYDTGDGGKLPILRVSGVPVYKTNYQLIGDGATITSSTPPTDNYQRNRATSGTDYGDTATRTYYSRVWRDDSNNRLMNRTWYEDYDAAGRRFNISAPTDYILLESCT